MSSPDQEYHAEQLRSATLQSPPRSPAPHLDYRDELITELRADKARLIAEVEGMRKTLLALTDRNAYNLRYRDEILAASASRTAQLPAPQTVVSPYTMGQLWAESPTPKTYEEIEASFRQPSPTPE